MTLGVRPAPTRASLRRRREQRGAALFIAVMIITMLTAIGVFSMQAASLADQAAGFNRQGVQTNYVAEFAARATMAELVGKEQHYFQRIASGTDDCRNNAALYGVTADGQRLPCYKLQTSELWERVNGTFPGHVGNADGGDVVGELSRSELQGAFIVEMTDMARVGAPVVGEDAAQDAFRFMQVVLTSTGHVRPGGGSNSVCNSAFAATSGLSNLRAQVTFGPVF